MVTTLYVTWSLKVELVCRKEALEGTPSTLQGPLKQHRVSLLLGGFRRQHNGQMKAVLGRKALSVLEKRDWRWGRHALGESKDSESPAPSPWDGAPRQGGEALQLQAGAHGAALPWV